MKDKPDGDVNERPNDIERTRHKADREGKTPAQVCKADHTFIRGRHCGYCGTYFRGDDMG